jgi:hypothetical protein
VGVAYSDEQKPEMGRLFVVCGGQELPRYLYFYRTPFSLANVDKWSYIRALSF